MQHKDEYQNTAHIYDFLFSRAFKSIRNSIRTFLTSSNAINVVDLCCGTGEQLRSLADRDMLLTGVDLSSAMLNQARQKSPGTISYLESDAGNTQLPAGKYDGVIISFGLHEKSLQQHQKIFREACRLVHPGGHILVADYCTPPEEIVSQFMSRICIQFIEKLAGINHYHSYKNWMANGAVDGFLHRNNPGKLSLISEHFKGCVRLLTVSNVTQPKN